MFVVCVCRFGISFIYVIESIDSKLISVCLINDYSLIADLHIFVYQRAELSSISLECTKVKLSVLNNFVRWAITWQKNSLRNFWKFYVVLFSSISTLELWLIYVWKSGWICIQKMKIRHVEYEGSESPDCKYLGLKEDKLCLLEEK